MIFSPFLLLIWASGIEGRNAYEWRTCTYTTWTLGGKKGNGVYFIFFEDLLPRGGNRSYSALFSHGLVHIPESSIQPVTRGADASLRMFVYGVGREILEREGRIHTHEHYLGKDG